MNQSILRDFAHLLQAERDAMLATEYGGRRRFDALMPEEREEHRYLFALEERVRADMETLPEDQPSGDTYAPLVTAARQRVDIAEDVTEALLEGAILVAPRATVGPYQDALFAVITDPGGVIVELVDDREAAPLYGTCPVCKVSGRFRCVDRAALAALCEKLGPGGIERELALRGRDALGPVLIPMHRERLAVVAESWRKGHRWTLERHLSEKYPTDTLDGVPVELVMDRGRIRYRVDNGAPVGLDEALDQAWLLFLRRQAALKAAACFVGERGAGLDGAAAALQRWHDR